MTHPRGKNIIFGERFDFKTETETNIVTDNFLPVEQDATVFDDLYINYINCRDYILDNYYDNIFKNVNDNLSQVIINAYNKPKIVVLKINIRDYITENVTVTLDQIV